MSNSRYVTLDDLDAAGLTEQDVRERCPHATEYTALDGRPCWRREDLTTLLGEEPEEGDV